VYHKAARLTTPDSGGKNLPQERRSKQEFAPQAVNYPAANLRVYRATTRPILAEHDLLPLLMEDT